MNRFISTLRGLPTLRGLVGAAVLIAAPGAWAQTAPARPPAANPSKAAPPTAPAPAIPAMEPRAVDLLKAMSARLAAAQSMSFTATVAIEQPSRLGPPILYASRYDVTMQRPDKLRVLLSGDGPASEFYLDGKTMMAYAPAADLVATAEAPPTIEAALKKAFDSAAIYFPFTDILVPDPAKVLIEGGKMAFYIGPSVMQGGVKTEMVAWADSDVFLQIWIGADDKLPRRIRAVYRTDPSGFRHDMELSGWTLDAAPAADAFGSAKAKAGKPIAFSHPAATAVPPPGAASPATKPAKQPAPTPAARPQ